MTISTPRWPLRHSCARWSSATTPFARNVIRTVAVCSLLRWRSANRDGQCPSRRSVMLSRLAVIDRPGRRGGGGAGTSATPHPEPPSCFCSSRPDPSPDPANNRLHPRTIYGRVETRALGRGTGIKHFGDDRAVFFPETNFVYLSRVRTLRRERCDKISGLYPSCGLTTEPHLSEPLWALLLGVPYMGTSSPTLSHFPRRSRGPSISLSAYASFL